MYINRQKEETALLYIWKGEKTMNENKNDGLGYKMGSILTIVVTLCLMVATIGVTIKFLFWMF